MEKKTTFKNVITRVNTQIARHYYLLPVYLTAFTYGMWVSMQSSLYSEMHIATMLIAWIALYFLADAMRGIVALGLAASLGFTLWAGVVAVWPLTILIEYGAGMGFATFLIAISLYAAGAIYSGLYCLFACE